MFRLIKSFVIDLHRTIRPDLFVKNHINAMDTELTLAFSKAIKQMESSSQNEKSDEKASITVQKANDINISSNEQTVMPNRDRNIKSILIPQMRTHMHQDVPMLPNGSELQQGKTSIVMTHACAFNSVTSAFAAAYIDCPNMRNKIENSTCKFAAFLKLLFQKGIDSKVEFVRYEFLREIFPDRKAIKELKNLVSFNCDVSISGLFTSMCASNADIMSSRQRTEKCSKCGHQDVSASSFVNFNYDGFDFKNVQQFVVAERTRVCNTCLEKTMTIEDQFHGIIAIDCESSQQNELTTINDIQNQINLNEDQYDLFAAIQYDPDMKHVIPHIKRISNYWETYDDLNRKKSVTNINEGMLVFMLFYKRKTNGIYLVACALYVFICLFAYLFIYKCNIHFI